MLNLFIIFIVLIVLYALYNLINYLRFPYIENLFVGNYTDNAESKIKAKTHKSTILNYIKHSGVKDKYIPVSQPLGFGQIANGNVSIFQNILNERKDFAFNSMEFLMEAKGNYWYKFVNSFNPFYWLRIFLYIPKNVLTYLGINSDSVIIKLIQLIYWLIGIIFTILTSIFPEEVKSFILSIINPS